MLDIYVLHPRKPICCTFDDFVNNDCVFTQPRVGEIPFRSLCFHTSQNWMLEFVCCFHRWLIGPCDCSGSGCGNEVFTYGLDMGDDCIIFSLQTFKTLFLSSFQYNFLSSYRSPVTFSYVQDGAEAGVEIPPSEVSCACACCAEEDYYMCKFYASFYEIEPCITPGTYMYRSSASGFFLGAPSLFDLFFKKLYIRVKYPIVVNIDMVFFAYAPYGESQEAGCAVFLPGNWISVVCRQCPQSYNCSGCSELRCRDLEFFDYGITRYFCGPGSVFWVLPFCVKVLINRGFLHYFTFFVTDPYKNESKIVFLVPFFISESNFAVIEAKGEDACYNFYQYFEGCSNFIARWL